MVEEKFEISFKIQGFLRNIFSPQGGGGGGGLCSSGFNGNLWNGKICVVDIVLLYTQ